MIAGLVFVSMMAVPAGHAETVRVACVGASITAGVGTGDPSTESYPAQLQKILGNGYEVRAFGRSGATVTKSSGQSYWFTPEHTASRSFRPNIVIFQLGGNDGQPSIWPKVKNDFVHDFKELIDTYRTSSTSQVFLCLPTPAWDDRRENLAYAVLPLTKQVAREKWAQVIDLYSPLEGMPELFPDKLHPNPTAAGIMAMTIAEAIEDPVARKKSWKVVSVDSEERGEGPASAAIDGDTYTYWHTNYSQNETKPPHEIVVDMGAPVRITAFRHLPRQDGGVNGRVKGFELYFSQDGKTWGAPALTGEIKNVSEWTTLPLPETITARYFKFKALSEWHNGPWTSVGEFDVRRAMPGANVPVQ